MPLATTLPHVPGFELHRTIGSGGMGSVYQATDTRSGQSAAVKVLSPDHVTDLGRRRFEHEARAIMSVEHPNVCAAYDFGVLDDGRLFLAMERLEGEDLSKRIRRDGRLPVASAVRIARGAALGLARAHGKGLIHRDVKPSNLFLCRDEGGDPGVVKVLDFGLAIFAEGDAARVTRTGDIVGTPGYMAPEQARGERTQDGRSDVFSLGVVLYYAIAGVPPFGDDAPIAVVVRMLTEEPTPLGRVCPSVPSALSDVVMSAIARRPEDRPQTMGALADALEELLPALSDELPSMALEDTDQVHYEHHSLVEEQRVMTALLANGVRDVAMVVGAIQRFGGRAAELAGGQVVGLFGADGSEGDEADRAVRAALEYEDSCAVIGIGTGRSQHGRSSISGQALRTAEMATSAETGGVRADEQTRRRLGDRYLTEGTRVVRMADVAPVEDRVAMVGREADLADFATRITRAFEDEEPAGALVLGGAGVGKTRLVGDLLERVRAAAPDVQILHGGGESSRRYTAWHAIGRAIRGLCGLDTDSPPEDVRKVTSGLALEAGVGETCGAILGAALGVPLAEGLSVAADHARRDPTVMRGQIINAIGELLEARVGFGPLLLVLDDVQWADSASLELVPILFERLVGCPAFALLTGRPHAMVERPDLLDTPHLERRDLKELSRKASAELARAVLGSRGEGNLVVSPSIIEIVAEHSAGNPFFVLEICDNIARKMSLHGPEGFDAAAFALPLTVEAAVQSRLDHLPVTDKDLLKRASVFGERFWREGLEAQGGPDPGQALSRLWRGSHVVRPPRRDLRLSGFEEYAFKHRAVREVAYGMLTADQRRSLHLAAGRWLASAEGVVGEAAQHLTEGGDPKAACGLWARAAEQARRDGDLSAVLRTLGRALEGVTEAGDEARLRLDRAEAAVQSGHYDVAEGELDALPSGLPALGTAGRARELVLRGRVLRVRGGGTRDENHRTAFNLFEEAAALLEAVGDRPVQAAALTLMATSECYGRLGDGLALAQRAVEVAGEDAAARARARAGLCLLWIHDGAISRAGRGARMALEDAREAGDLVRVVSLLGDMAYVHLQLGEWDEAVERLREVIDRGRRIGDVRAAGYAWHNLGLALLRSGDVGAALEAEDRALDMAANAGNVELAAYCQLYRALILLEQGDLEEAERAARSALLANASTADEPAVRTVLARVHRAAGRADQAIGEAERAAQLRSEAGHMLEFELDLLWVHASVLHDLGRDAEGDAVLAEARELLSTRAERATEDDQARERFLEEIPLHRAIRSMTEAAAEGVAQ